MLMNLMGDTRQPLLRLNVTREDFGQHDQARYKARYDSVRLAGRLKAMSIDGVELNELHAFTGGTELLWESLTCTYWRGGPSLAPFPVEHLTMMPCLTVLNLVRVSFVSSLVDILHNAPRLEVLRFDPVRLNHDVFVDISNRGSDCPQPHASLREIRVGTNVYLSIPYGFFNALVFPNLESLRFDGLDAPEDGNLFYEDPPPRLHTLIGVRAHLTHDYPNLRVLGHWVMEPVFIREILKVALGQAPRLEEYVIPCRDLEWQEFSKWVAKLGDLSPHPMLRFVSNARTRSHAASSYAQYATPGPEDGDEVVYELAYCSPYRLVIRTDRSAPPGSYIYELLRPGVPV